MSTMTLHTPPGNFRAFKALIAAQYAGVNVEVTPDFKMGVDNKTPAFLALNPLGKVPCLETAQGGIFESNAIARYIARIRADSSLYGGNFFQSGQVDAWVDFGANEVEVPATMWVYPILGYMAFDGRVYHEATKGLNKALKVLEGHLASRTFMVGRAVSLADIVLVSALVLPFKMVMDKKARKPYPCVMRWFNTCVNQPEFQAVLGETLLCAKALTAGKAPADAKGGKAKKGKAKQQKKKKKAAAAPAQQKPKKKAKHPLECLPKSSMHIDSWKREYKAKYYGAMPWLWENLDKAGYSIYFQKYNYDSENKKAFMTCNQVGGFLQRCDAIRKYAMGTMQVIGSEATGLFVVGCWIFRGDTEKHMLDCNPDAEYYTWTRVTEFTDAEKKRIADIWCSEDKIDGKEILDCKVFV